MEWFSHGVLLRGLVGRAPGEGLQFLDPRPLVRVRAVYGRAIATTTTHVLHEWRKAGELHARWDEKWQVHRVNAEEWRGERID